MFKHILVPIDDSEITNDSIINASRLARETGACITFYLAQAIVLPSITIGDISMPDAALIESIQAINLRYAETVLSNAVALAKTEGVEANYLTDECDRPYQGIIAAAETLGCDLIYMRSHGRRPASTLILGSVTQGVLSHCKIPVLVYR